MCFSLFVVPMLSVCDVVSGSSLNDIYRLELEQLEREKREREIRELRERELNDRLKEEIMKSAGAAPRMPTPMEPPWLELQRR